MLGRAFARICSERGLVFHLADEQEPHLIGVPSIETAIGQHAPWAVIDARRSMAVDDAERDPEACYRLHVAGPVSLATVCARRGIPFVTFSSDLVFGGTQHHPYLEDDSPNPLNVYGACQVEAERRVLDVLPHALVIRTSAPFGPWDDGTFLGSMFRALDRGERFGAPMDTMMSPTYIPDLVHAVLDLLIDRESGVWHLSNEGSVTWFELARRAALRTGRAVVENRAGRDERSVEPRRAAGIQRAVQSSSEADAPARRGT